VVKVVSREIEGKQPQLAAKKTNAQLSFPVQHDYSASNVVLLPAGFSDWQFATQCRQVRRQ